jgi:hypothetical protein
MHMSGQHLYFSGMHAGSFDYQMPPLQCGGVCIKYAYICFMPISI